MRTRGPYRMWPQSGQPGEERTWMAPESWDGQETAPVKPGRSSARAGKKQGGRQFSGGTNQKPQLLTRRLRYAQRSADLECNLNGGLVSDGNTVGPLSGLKPPVFDRLNGPLFQSITRSLHDLNVFRSAVRRYDNL